MQKRFRKLNVLSNTLLWPTKTMHPLFALKMALVLSDFVISNERHYRFALFSCVFFKDQNSFNVLKVLICFFKLFFCRVNVKKRSAFITGDSVLQMGWLDRWNNIDVIHSLYIRQARKFPNIP